MKSYIVARVPGTGGAEFWLTVAQARRLIRMLRRRLEQHYAREYAKRKKVAQSARKVGTK
jgi:hypothetical protein